MRIFDRKIPFVLLAGDVLCFVVALWLTLTIRYLAIPGNENFLTHLLPFSILFVVWIIVFFASGLYERKVIVVSSKLSEAIIKTQTINSVVAVGFFYFVPLFSIAPKTNLFLYLAILLPIIIWWRVKGYYFLNGKRKDVALLIGSGKEIKDLEKEVNTNSQYGMTFAYVVDVSDENSMKELSEKINTMKISVVVVDLQNEKVISILPKLYDMLFTKIRFVDMHSVYEEIFYKIALPAVGHSWFLENVSNAPKALYDSLKRMMDIVISLILGIISLVVYPFVYLAIKIEDPGPIFFIQKRVGKNASIIKLIKFRSMRAAKNTSEVEGERVLKVGKIIRKTRIDELPQLWNVLKGDLSMIGPRPETPELVETYSKQIPYYKVRHLIKPGLSGWAQLYQKTPPKFGVDYDQTKDKLSYDLYYVKNRSLLVDIGIALKTTKEILMSRGI